MAYSVLLLSTQQTSNSLAQSSDESVGDDEQSYEIKTDDEGLEFHCAARVDGEHKHPLGATVTEVDSHESPQFDHLKDDVGVFTDLDSIVWVFDRGYTHYRRFCEIKHSDDDFATLLQSHARVGILNALQNIEVPGEKEVRQIRVSARTHRYSGSPEPSWYRLRWCS